MSRNPVVVVALVAACIVVGGLAQRNLRTGLAGPRGEMPFNAGGETIHVTPTARRAVLHFAGHVAPDDRQWVLASIAAANPRARALIAEVDGMVTVETAGQGSMMGLTTMRPRGFTIWLNLARLNGRRKIDRNQTVLHEFGHVVDFTLLDAATDRRLDDAIPRTGSCMVQDGTKFGDCADPEERIADTFAKWALGNAVSAVGAGYAISDPPSLADWGRPLDALAAALPAA